MKLMANLQILAVPAGRAAKMLSLPTKEFERLVDNGILPQPIPLGRNLLWSVRELEAVLLADGAEPQEFRV